MVKTQVASLERKPRNSTMIRKTIPVTFWTQSISLHCSLKEKKAHLNVGPACLHCFSSIREPVRAVPLAGDLAVHCVDCNSFCNKVRNDSLQFAEGYMRCTVLYAVNESRPRYTAFNVIFVEERGRGRGFYIYFNCSARYYQEQLAGTFSTVMAL